MISVCVATYNGEKYIKEQLLSILGQLSMNDEVIVSDDGSSDKTLDIIRNLNDSRVKIYDNVRHGIIGNFENAISKAGGDYLFLSDQDDVWLDCKVPETLALLQHLEKENTEIPVLVFSDVTITDSNLKIIHKSTFCENKYKPSEFTSMNILSVANNIMGCTIAFNKKALQYILPIDNDAVMHDWWIALVISKYGITAPLDKPTILYRQHNNNEVGSSLMKSRGFFDRIKTFRNDVDFNRRIFKMVNKVEHISVFTFIYRKLRLHI